MCSGKKVLLEKVALNEPLDLSSQKNDHVDSKIKDAGVVLHVQEEVYQSTLNLIKDKIPFLGLDIV